MAQQAKVIESIRRLLRLLPQGYTRRFVFLLVAAVVVAFVETGAVGLIALFASAITNPQTLLGSELLARFVRFTGHFGGLTPQRLLMILGLAVIIAVVFKNGLRAALQYGQSNFVAFVSGYLGDRMLTGVMRMPYQWILRENSADLMSTVSWSGNSGAFLSYAFMASTEIVLLVCLTLALVAANPVVVLSSVLMLGAPAALILRVLRRRIDTTAKALAEHRHATNRHLVTALQGIKDVKAYGQEEAFCRAFRAESYAATSMQARMDIYACVPNWLLETVGFMLLFLATFLMYTLAGDSPLRVTGTIALLAVTAWRGLPAAIRVVTSVNNFRGYLPYVHHTLTHMEMIGEWAVGGHGDEAKRIRPAFERDLRAEGLGFRYEGSDAAVLEAVSFCVSKGETVGIVGESGAGKSTLMDLLMGLLAPTSGALCLDGKPLDEPGRRGLAEIIGYVPQFPYIYDATLAENVAFGVLRAEIDLARVEAACRQAAVHEFLVQLPEGYQTVLGERGVRLSGGQQQRVCIARALYRRPEVLIFDEATSSLDTKSEKQIQQTIMRLKGSVTMILVAHRLSTVEGCDRLVWVEDGRVRQVGSPVEVLPGYRAVLARHGQTDGQMDDQMDDQPDAAEAAQP